MVQPLWKTLPPCDLATLFLGIYSIENIHLFIKRHVTTFISALFLTIPSWKLPKFPTHVKWIKINYSIIIQQNTIQGWAPTIYNYMHYILSQPHRYNTKGGKNPQMPRGIYHYESIFMKFKQKQNQSMVLEARLSFVEDGELEEVQGGLL